MKPFISSMNLWLVITILSFVSSIPALAQGPWPLELNSFLTGSTPKKAAIRDPYCSSAMPNAWNSDAFTLEVSCETRCKFPEGAAVVVSQTEERFDPEALGLVRGNGNLWTPLTAELQLRSQQACLEVALERCKGLERVASSKPTQLRSGAWRATLPSGCQTQETILSPYDKQVREKLRTTAPTPRKQTLSVEMNAMGEVLDPEKPLSCAHPLKANLCFGDCMTFDLGTALEVLATTTPNATKEIAVCADSLQEWLAKNRHLAPDVLKFHCESFFWTSLRAQRKSVLGLTCGSVRADVHCDSLGRPAAPLQFGPKLD